MKIELNDDEARVFLEMVNIAVKAAGLDAAEAALHFKRKIDAAKAEENAPVPAPENDAEAYSAA
jgi:hypothetical protein